jgi:putative ABC transport system permease protein
MGPLISDLRYAAREFRRRPYFTLAAIFSLALGIGATSAVFSVIYAVLINPFPYPGADRIVELRLKDKAGSDHFVVLSAPQLDQLRQTHSIESAVGLNWWNLTTTDGDLPEDLQAVAVTTNSASHFGIPAIKGRWFIPSDAPPGEDPQRVAVLSYQFWQRYFVGDPNVVGRKFQLVHDTYEVIGVMPPRFKWDDAEVYIPQRVTQDPRSSRCRTPAAGRTVRETIAVALSRQFLRRSSQHRRPARQAARPHPLPPAGRGRFPAANRLRQCFDLASRQRSRAQT